MILEEHQLRRIRETEIAKGCIGSRRGLKYRLRRRDNKTRAKGRDPTLFVRPKSGG